MANNCTFALSSCAFAQSSARACALAKRLRAGMSAANDLEGSTCVLAVIVAAVVRRASLPPSSSPRALLSRGPRPFVAPRSRFAARPRNSRVCVCGPHTPFTRLSLSLSIARGRGMFARSLARAGTARSRDRGVSAATSRSRCRSAGAASLASTVSRGPKGCAASPCRARCASITHTSSERTGISAVKTVTTLPSPL